jgi:hypothetical protein
MTRPALAQPGWLASITYEKAADPEKPGGRFFIQDGRRQ